MQVFMSSKDESNVSEDPRTDLHNLSDELPVMTHCASCGKSEDDNGGSKLKTCTACKSVKYCSVDCQRDHRKAHKKECKRIENDLKEASAAAADLAALNMNGKKNMFDEDADADLFKPPPPKEECALCFLPLPVNLSQKSRLTCCGQVICAGCRLKHDSILCWSNCKRLFKQEPEVDKTCPFCREPMDISDEELMRRHQERMALGDAQACCAIAISYAHGSHGLSKDNAKAAELYLRAVELGSAVACLMIAAYYSDEGYLGCDIAKETYFLKLAAKRGHIKARHNLGLLEYGDGNFELAVKHWMISAKAGDNKSLNDIGVSYRNKHAIKDQFEEAIRACQKAKEDMSSKERDMAKKYEDGGYKLTALSETELAQLCGVHKRDLEMFGRFYSYLKKKDK